MMKGLSTRDGKLLLFLLLLIMILMRLVWLQLRTYPVTMSPRSALSLPAAVMEDLKGASSSLESPGHRWILQSLSNSDGRLATKRYVHTAQWQVVAIVFAVVLTSRFLSGSWIFALMVGAAIMSRGRLIASVGEIDRGLWLASVLMLWLAFASHFIRTAAVVSFLGLTISSLALALFDVAFILHPLILCLGLTLVMVLRPLIVKPALQQLRRERGRRRQYEAAPARAPASTMIIKFRSRDYWQWVMGWLRRDLTSSEKPDLYRRGSLWRTLSVPFPVWLSHARAWLWLLLPGISLTLIGGILWGFWLGPVHLNFDLTRVSASWIFEWFSLLVEPMDFYLSVAFLILVLSLIQGPTLGLKGYWEIAWLLVIALGLVLTLGMAADLWDYLVISQTATPTPEAVLAKWGRADEILLWFEPAIMTMGSVGIYHLLKIMSRRIFATT